MLSCMEKHVLVPSRQIPNLFLLQLLLLRIRIFISKGIEVNKIANSGGTALMFAAGGGHNETTRLLLDFKADPNIVVQAKPEYIFLFISNFLYHL